MFLRGVLQFFFHSNVADRGYPDYPHEYSGSGLVINFLVIIVSGINDIAFPVQYNFDVNSVPITRKIKYEITQTHSFQDTKLGIQPVFWGSKFFIRTARISFYCIKIRFVPSYCMQLQRNPRIQRERRYSRVHAGHRKRKMEEEMLQSA